MSKYLKLLNAIIFTIGLFFWVGCIKSGSSEALKIKLRLADASLKKDFTIARQKALIEEIYKVNTLFYTNEFKLYETPVGYYTSPVYDNYYCIIENRDKGNNPLLAVPVIVLKDTFFINVKYKQGKPITGDTFDIVNNIEIIRNEMKSYYEKNELEEMISDFRKGIFITRRVHYRHAD